VDGHRLAPENLPDYFRNGASAAAIGSGVFRRDWLAAKKFRQVRSRIRDYLKVLPAGL